MTTSEHARGLWYVELDDHARLADFVAVDHAAANDANPNRAYLMLVDLVKAVVSQKMPTS